jgi:hypothetical protein
MQISSEKSDVPQWDMDEYVESEHDPDRVWSVVEEQDDIQEDADEKCGKERLEGQGLGGPRE